MAGKRVEFHFVGDTADLERSLRAVASEGREAGDQVEEGGKRGAKGLGKAEKASKALKGGLLAVTAAAAAAAAGTVAVVKAAVDFAARADLVAKKAAAIGTSAEELQLLTGALELGGVSAETTAASIQKLQVNLGLAAKGGKLQAEALKDLKLTSDQLEGVPLDERIALIADGLSSMTSQSARAQTAQALLGRGALDMLAAFKEGGAGIRNNTELIRETGIISNETAAEAEALTDSVALLSQKLNNMRDESLAPTLPLLTIFADSMRDALGEIDPGVFDSLGEAANTALIDTLAPIAITVGAEVSKAFISMKASIKGVTFGMHAASATATVMARALMAAGLAATGNFSEAKEMLTGGMAKAVKAWRDFESAGLDVGSALGAVDVAADKMREALGSVREEMALNDAIAYLDTLDETEDAARGAADGAQDLADNAGKVKEKLDDAGKAAKDASKEVDLLSGVLTDVFMDELDRADRLDALKEEDAEREAERQQSAVDARKERNQEALDSAAALSDATFQIMQQAAAAELGARVSAAQKTKDEIADLEEQITNAATEGERIRLEAQKAALVQKQADEKEAAMQAFHASQALAVTQAIISTALSIISMLQVGPAGIPLSIAAGITGAATIAAIAATPPPQLHSGGMVPSVHDEVMIRARSGEAVLSPQGVAAAGGVGGVNALNAGGAGNGQNVTVFQVGHKVLDSMVHESLRRPAGRLTRELRAVRPRRVGSYNPHRS